MDIVVIIKSKLTLAILLAGLLVSPVYGQDSEPELTFSGEINFGSRIYFDSGLYSGQTQSSRGLFAGFAVNASLDFGAVEFVASANGTLDDAYGRSNLRLEKAYATTDFGNLNVLVGYNVENWGSAISSSPTNFINPVDFSDRMTTPLLIGTPMINANYLTDYGTFSAYFLTGMVESEFGNAQTRQRAFWRTNGDRARFQKADKNDVDVALRYTNNFSIGGGNFDVAASYFKGTNRTPVNLPGCITAVGAVTEAICNTVNATVQTAYENSVASSGSAHAFWAFLEATLTDATAAALSQIPAVGFFPYYNEIERVGLDVNYSVGDLQLRFEGTFNETSRNNYVEAVIGGDYTFNNFADGDGTLTVAVEYLYSELAKSNPFVVFGDDVFLGLDYRTNNANDLSFNTGFFYDLNSNAVLATAKATTRLSDSMSLELAFQKVFVTGYNDPLAFAKRDGFLELKVRTFF